MRKNNENQSFKLPKTIAKVTQPIELIQIENTRCAGVWESFGTGSFSVRMMLRCVSDPPFVWEKFFFLNSFFLASCVSGSFAAGFVSVSIIDPQVSK